MDQRTIAYHHSQSGLERAKTKQRRLQRVLERKPFWFHIVYRILRPVIAMAIDDLWLEDQVQRYSDGVRFHQPDLNELEKIRAD